MKKMSVFALLAALAMVLVAPAAFATEHPPGPPSNMIVAAQSALEKANPDFQLASAPSTAMLVANDCNIYHKSIGTTAPAAMQDTIGTHLQLALTGPPSAAGVQQQNNDKAAIEPGALALTDHKQLFDSNKPDGSPGLVASGSDSFYKGSMYTDIGSARFTAAAPTPKASLLLGMASGSGTMDAAAQLTAAMKTATHYGLARAPDILGAIASMQPTAHGSNYTATERMGTGP